MNLPSATLLGQSILSGIFVGALYGLVGLGLSLSWGMLRQINLAHFALAFLAAYLSYSAHAAGVDPFLSLVALVPLFFLIGVAMHWAFDRFQVSAFNSLLVTFGFTVMIEALIQWQWTADFRKLEWHGAAVRYKVGTLFVPLPELLTLVIAVVTALALWAVMRYTDMGRAMRAAAEDSAIAAAFGIDSRKLAYGLAGVSAALAAIAGVCIAVSFSLTPSQIYAWVGVVFAAVMIGGLGKPLGPLVAGLLIGVSEAVAMVLTAPAWAPLVSFSLLIIVLLARAERV
jgi:branched-chain amino acid transport system permease protein